jgi:SPP1 family predicted phage head-tail adaptor
MLYEPLDAGKLDKRITIQTPARTDDGGGGVTIAYTDAATVWASIEPGSGREFFQARQLNPEITHTVTIRYRSGITPAQRIKYVENGTARAFAIHSKADPLERHEQLILMCEEQTPT